MFGFGKKIVPPELAVSLFISTMMEFAKEHAPYIKDGLIQAFKKLGEDEDVEISENAVSVSYFCTICGMEMLALENI